MTRTCGRGRGRACRPYSPGHGGSREGPGVCPVTAGSPVPAAPEPVDAGYRLPAGHGHGTPGLTQTDLQEIRTVVRRVVAARVRDRHVVDDLVQETLARVLAQQHAIEPGAALPYAISTARNLVASSWRQADRTARNLHRVVDLLQPAVPDEALLAREESDAVTAALSQLSERDRQMLLAHDVDGRDTASLAGELQTSAGAVAAQLKRTRARLRVEYLLALDGAEPPTPLCRPVLLALSGGDRRRQREIDVSGHLLACSYCAELSRPLAERGEDASVTRIPVATDADVVLARQAGRELALALGFGTTDGTLIATAISEVTRNIVKFAGTGEVRVSGVQEPARCGLLVVARDAGPGIPDVQEALSDGHSTYGGLGLGLPGCRRLMDDFVLDSVPGTGTTVTMCKWRRTASDEAGARR